jgi:hypothetical protein
MERPYKPSIGAEICRRMVCGETLTSICEEEEMPAIATFFDWMEAHPELGEQYTRARDRQADVFSTQQVDLSDRCRVGEKIEVREENGTIVRKVVTADMVERTRLQIDARRWAASKMAPHKYGDRLAHQMLDEHGKPAKAGVVVIVGGATGEP